MNIKIVQDNGDFASLKEISESCLENYTLAQDKIAARAQKNDFTVLFAIQGRKKLGFIAGYGENNAMHIWLFGVLKHLRGKGIGSKLLKKFHQIAANKGYKTLNTITFNKYPGKIILSIKNGYKITGTKFIPEKNDTAIILGKEL